MNESIVGEKGVESEERPTELCLAVQLSCFCLMMETNSLKKMEDVLADVL